MRRGMIKALCIALCAAVLLWCMVFAVDLGRCSNLQAPIFVAPTGASADDGGSGVYQGLGYTVAIEKYLDPDFGVCVRSVEMVFLGKVVAASIA